MNPIFHLIAPSLDVVTADKYPSLHARLTALSEDPESLLAVPEEAKISLHLELGRTWEPLLATEAIKLAFAFTDLSEEDLDALRARFSFALIDESGPLLIRKTKHLQKALNAIIDELYSQAMLNLLHTCEEDPDETWKAEADHFADAFPEFNLAAAGGGLGKADLLHVTLRDAAESKHLGAFKHCFQALPAADKGLSLYYSVLHAFLPGLNYAIDQDLDLSIRYERRNLAHLVVREITAETREEYLPVLGRLIEKRPEMMLELDRDRLSPMGFAALLGKYHLFEPPVAE